MWLRSLTPYLLAFSICLSARGYRPVQDERVRLVGGKHLAEGRVEVYHRGQWGTVCDDSWDEREARVVCRQLGFSGAQSAVPGGRYGQGSGPVWLDDLSCEGNESSLADCKFKGWGVTDCSHSEDAGVICERDRSLSNSQVYPLDHALKLSRYLGALFDSGRGCDFTVVVQSPGGEPGEDRVCTHRLVLSMHPKAPFLKAAQESQSYTMQVHRECRPYVTEFLRYLYTLQVDITVASAPCLHRLASGLGLEQLQEDSGRLFTWLLPQDPTFRGPVSLYSYAVESGDLALQETCLQYLAWNGRGLVESPAWGNLSQGALAALLARSDLVVPDEGFVLRGLESWVRAQPDPPGSEAVASLLGAIRFPMISAEQLYDLCSTSDLYASHRSLFKSGTLEAYQFNLLPLAKLREHMERKREQHSPRIYTATPWSLSFNFSTSQRSYGGYNQYGRYDQYSSYFQTPVHNSALFQREMVSWTTSLCRTRQECLNRGQRGDFAPAAWLTANTDLSRYRGSIRYSNKIVLSCDGEYVFHVQDFKDNIAQIATNSSTSPGYPCNDNQFFYRFVVSPQYVF
ncbi:galectin-3-binding protein A-like [Anguilla anguilla]|uniref:galectin-3-binding protein A-like n=1 Tax=Anguilla anguilla TaxID=7936 RepID=UPI0015AF08A7|nr:galectin-3-binding protein A-like [Anguilla anguilla]XP_035258038.1 galectin-3-binding protein A-like [Anguilla anguilla]